MDEKTTGLGLVSVLNELDEGRRLEVLSGKIVVMALSLIHGFLTERFPEEPKKLTSFSVSVRFRPSIVRLQEVAVRSERILRLPNSSRESQMSKVKGVVDLVILLDVTGSMEACLNAVKTNVRGFIETFSTSDANNQDPVKDWRIKVCGYRDFTANPSDWFVDNPFVSTIPEVEAQLNNPNMEASGGVDEPESLLDALLKIATMGNTGPQDLPSPLKWRAIGRAARVVVFFTDATFHASIRIPEGSGGAAQDVINHLQQNRIKMVGFAPEWMGYHELGSCEGAEIDNFVEGAPVAAIGQPGPAGDAAALASQNALAGLSSDRKGFQALMRRLAATVTAIADVLPVDG
jgi:hypothetical protein